MAQSQLGLARVCSAANVVNVACYGLVGSGSLGKVSKMFTCCFVDYLIPIGSPQIYTSSFAGVRVWAGMGYKI